MGRIKSVFATLKPSGLDASGLVGERQSGNYLIPRALMTLQGQTDAVAALGMITTPPIAPRSETNLWL